MLDYNDLHTYLNVYPILWHARIQEPQSDNSRLSKVSHRLIHESGSLLPTLSLHCVELMEEAELGMGRGK